MEKFHCPISLNMDTDICPDLQTFHPSSNETETSQSQHVMTLPFLLLLLSIPVQNDFGRNRLGCARNYPYTQGNYCLLFFLS